MLNELIMCTEITLKLLNELYKRGNITKEEYEKHVKVKTEFLSKYNKKSIC